MGIEHRDKKRIPFNQQVLINNSMKVNAIDISEGGIYVHTGRMFPVGDIVDAMIYVGSSSVNLKASVQHCQLGVGMGLEFVELTLEQQEKLRILMKELETKSSASDKKHVLIVDDNDMVRRMNKSRLVLDGYTVFEAKNGPEAIKVFQSEHIDLAIVDLYMEPIDGFKLTNFIRQMPEHTNTPVIVFSARSTPEVIDQAMGVGANLFLVKMTTSPVKLSESVKSLLKQK
ncbi:MAG: response regulator [Nitrospiraceae bacterium]|nr:response regulator [Nitrospiraceae bacterium]